MNIDLPRIGIIQYNPKIGDIENNLKKIKEQYLLMSSNNVDLIVTSELAILGYPPRDLLHRESILNKEKEALNQIKKLTKNRPPIIVGHTSVNENDGPPLYNSASVLSEGNKIAQYNKRLLPTYDIFDESRYFSEGKDSTSFNIKNHKIGITICEDAWYDHYVTGNQRYSYNPVDDYTDCDILVNLSASPFKVDKFKNRENRFATHAEKLNSVYVFANQVGGNDDILFDGTSFIIDNEGSTIYRAPFAKSNVCTYKQDNSEKLVSNIPSETEQLRKIISLGIKDYVEKTGFDDVIIGLSGGIDSTVTANLAVDALGKDNVHGITLPSSITSNKNLSDAKKVAENLGIKFNELAISDINNNYTDLIKDNLNIDQLDTITKENIQARTRGVILMSIANEYNKLVLTPDNKSEAAVGYCTLYGDAVGAIGPLGDCTKDRVYNLAELFNENPPNNISEKPIPESVIKKDPTAELSENQKDSNEIPPYNIIDEVVKLYVEGDKNIKQINNKLEVDKQQVKDVVSRITKSEFKRKQTPPALRVTDKAFDSGWRYPIAASYNSILDAEE